MRNILIILVLIVSNILFAQPYEKSILMEDGTIKIEKYHQNGNIFSIEYWWCGQKTGMWEQFNEEGNLTYRASFKGGELHKVQVFEEQCISTEIIYSKGKQDKIISYIN